MPQPQTIDDRTIINSGLARIGASPIGALNEDTPKARQCLAVYYPLIDDLLGRRQWSFADQVYRLDALAHDALNNWDATQNKFINGWLYGYALPAVRLSPPHRVLRDPRRPDDPWREFTVEGGYLYCDYTPIWALFTVRARPDVWAPAFQRAATVLAAADFAVPIMHDANLAAALRAEGHGTPEQNGMGGLIGMAAVQDAGRGRTNAPAWRDPLTDARLR